MVLSLATYSTRLASPGTMKARMRWPPVMPNVAAEAEKVPPAEVSPFVVSTYELGQESMVSPPGS